MERRLRGLAPALLIASLLISLSSAEDDFQRCNCDDEGSLWSIESVLDTQRVSDFLIAVAYFSIPIELLYFVSCSNVPFKWVLFEFIAFIVLCGLTHLLNGWTYGPHSFQLMLALTVFKILTALVSCATAITLITLIPLLLKVKVREFMLKKKAWDLGREVGLIMKQKETGVYVRMLTHEIRKSLDRHTILYTTLVELSKTLDLQNCAVWMPNEIRTEMNLTHELNRRDYPDDFTHSIPIANPDVKMINRSEEVNILGPDSLLTKGSSRVSGAPGPVAAIRVPMLRVSNFKGGTPELIQTCYGILVCVLPGGQARDWTHPELEIVKVVADQVAVALSHAAVLEESQLMREQLVEQNRVLQVAKQNALRASQARVSFEKVMTDGMRRPMHSILGLLSVMQDEKLSADQRLIVDTMVRTGDVLSALTNDAMDVSRNNSGRLFPYEPKAFHLHSMIREAACLARCLCIYRGFNFSVDVEKLLPDHVIGDERRVFQVILHMVGNLLNVSARGGTIRFRVSSERGSLKGSDRRWAVWRQTPSNGDEGINVRFEMGIPDCASQPEGLVTDARLNEGGGGEDGLSFSICKKLVQLMQGSIYIVPNSQSFAQGMSLVLRFQLRSSVSISIPDSGEHFLDNTPTSSLFRGMQVLLADHDDSNRAVTRKLLGKLGCISTVVSSGVECLTAIRPSISSFQFVLLDLQMLDMDGFELAMRIRKFRSRSWPLIMAMTAGMDEDLWEKCLQVGINGVIRKPIGLRGLANELRRVLLQANRASMVGDSVGSSIASNKF